MNARTLALAAAATVIAACSTPPKPPTVDDAKKRPVNVSQAVDLQRCRSELSATKIVLTETLGAEQRPSFTPAINPAVVRIEPATPPAASAAASAEPNQVFVINFPLGSAELSLSAQQSAELAEQARAAKFIVIRGRTDAVADSLAEDRLAQRRAEAAYKYLIDRVRLPPEGIRLSWQGAGDPFEPGSTAANQQVNRRVEIELYRAKPEIQLLSLAQRSPRQSGVAGNF